MPSSFASRTGLNLARTPNHRQLAMRRRLIVALAVAGLALASGVVGSLVRPAPVHVAAATDTGPFSYFPQ